MPWKMTAVASVTIRGKVRMRVTIVPLISPRIVPRIEGGQEGDPDRQSPLGHHHGHDDAHQRHLVADGQIDASGDEHERQADGDDDEVGVLGDDVGEVPDGEELRVRDREEHDQPKQNEEDSVLPQHAQVYLRSVARRPLGRFGDHRGRFLPTGARCLFLIHSRPTLIRTTCTGRPPAAPPLCPCPV